MLVRPVALLSVLRKRWDAWMMLRVEQPKHIR